MYIILAIVAAILGYYMGKNAANTEVYLLQKELKEKEETLSCKWSEIYFRDQKINKLEKNLGYLLVTYPEIKDKLDRTLELKQDPILSEIINESISKRDTDGSKLKSHYDYQNEIQKLEDEIRDCKGQLRHIEITGKYTIAFRNIVIEHADALKDDVKIIKAYNYKQIDDSIYSYSTDVEIEFLKVNLPTYKDKCEILRNVKTW